MFLLLVVRDEAGVFFNLVEADKAADRNGEPVALVTLDEGVKLLDTLNGPADGPAGSARFARRNVLDAIKTADSEPKRG